MHAASARQRDPETLLKSEMLIQLWQQGRVTPERWQQLVWRALADNGAGSKLLDSTPDQLDFRKLMQELVARGYARTEQVQGAAVLVATDPDSSGNPV